MEWHQIWTRLNTGFTEIFEFLPFTTPSSSRNSEPLSLWAPLWPWSVQYPQRNTEVPARSMDLNFTPFYIWSLRCYLLRDWNAKTRHFAISSYTHFISRERLAHIWVLSRESEAYMWQNLGLWCKPGPGVFAPCSTASSVSGTTGGSFTLFLMWGQWGTEMFMPL